MAPVELPSTVSYVPASIATSHLLFAGTTSFITVRTIYRSYVALPPSSATRHRVPLRRGHVLGFSILAFLSLMVAGFYGAQFASLSYRVWATQRRVELPDSYFGDQGALRGGEHPGRLQLVRWLSETPFYLDLLEIGAEKARHFWWAQQLNFGLLSWSLYVAIEGQRRNISNLWTFLALAQLVGLSYAQNLFFVAVLLTPVPLPANIRELTKDEVPASSNWLSRKIAGLFAERPYVFFPHPALYISLLSFNFLLVFLIPYATNTPSFLAVTLSARIFPFLFILLPYLTPLSLGKFYEHPHKIQTTYTSLFRAISIFSFLLQIKSTSLAIFYNTPSDIYYRHSLLHPFKEEHRSSFDRASMAISRIFGAIWEHPAVSSVSWDVILSGLSLGVWAAIRGLDVNDMLGSTVPLLSTTKEKLDGGADSKVKMEDEAPSKVTDASPTSTRRRTVKPKRYQDEDEIPTTPSKKRRGKNSSKRHTSTDGDDKKDKTYHPDPDEILDEGDEDKDEDWEAAAVSWGLVAAGGLGFGSAAVYGAEVIAR